MKGLKLNIKRCWKLRVQNVEIVWMKRGQEGFRFLQEAGFYLVDLVQRGENTENGWMV